MTLSAPPPGPPPRSHRVSLEAVAREADVSVATASRALSGRAVRASLQERVESAARRLGYRPDLAAQAVARGATKTVALIVDYLRSPYGVEITRGVVGAASKHGLVVNVTGSEIHPGDLLEMIASVRAFRPRSLVLATGRVQDPDIRDELIRVLDAYQASGGSVAIVDGLDLPFASCAFDEVTAARALGRSLVRLGYRRPLVFNSSAERADLAARTHALIEGLELAGLERAAIRLAETPTAVSSTVGDDQLIDLDDADVVLCVEGAVLPGVYRHIRSLGLRVGADVAVTAFGQYEIADALRPHLTTVMLPLRRAGELAMEHALTDTTGAHLSLPCNLRMRASTPRRLGGGAPTRTGAAQPRRTDGRTVAVVVSGLTAADTGRVARELFSLARAGGQRCAVLTEDALLDDLTGSGSLHLYDALLVWGEMSAELAARVRETAIPCVTVDRPTARGVAQLSLEVAEGMQRLLEHLYALSHTRVAYLAGDDGDPHEKQRRWGIDLFSATHGDVIVKSAAATDAASGDALVALLDDGITALVTHDDVQGARVVQQLMAVGRDVPGDASVAGFGGGWASELSRPGLTTVQVDVAAAARAAWRLLSLAGGAGESRSLRAPLTVRGSTGTLRQVDDRHSSPGRPAQR